MVISLMHFPCGTTCLTIKKETQSTKWTVVSIIFPTIMGILSCFIIANIAKLIGY
jgi:ferrous iron transport protein B